MASRYRVKRSIEIAAAPSAVYPHVADFHRWVAWSPWEELDPDMTRTYTGAESGVGAAYRWSGDKKAGSGSMAITAATPERLEIDLRFEEPFPSASVTEFLLTPTPAGTRVEWRMTGQLKFVMRLFAIIKSFDSLVGPDFEKGLAKLKAVVEA